MMKLLDNYYPYRVKRKSGDIEWRSAPPQLFKISFMLQKFDPFGHTRQLKKQDSNSCS